MLNIQFLKWPFLKYSITVNSKRFILGKGEIQGIHHTTKHCKQNKVTLKTFEWGGGGRVEGNPA